MADYRKADILGQVQIAFGQGTGAVRVSHGAAREVRTHYGQLFERSRKAILKAWKDEAVQVLERVRTTGRLAAALTTDQGKTAIEARQVREAARRVERASATIFCEAPLKSE